MDPKGGYLSSFKFNSVLIHSGIFWEFYSIFRQKDIAVVGIFRWDLSESFIK